MNGWERLATVAAALCATPAFFIGFTDNDSRYVYFRPSDKVFGASTDQAKIDAAYAEALSANPELEDCRGGTAKVSGLRRGAFADVACETTELTAVLGGLRYAVWPIAFFWILVVSVRWVYRGFRPPK